MLRKTDIKIEGVLIQCSMDVYDDGREYEERKITTDGDIIPLLQRVASEGWQGYDEIMQEIRDSIAEREVDSAVDRYIKAEKESAGL